MCHANWVTPASDDLSSESQPGGPLASKEGNGIAEHDSRPSSPPDRVAPPQPSTAQDLTSILPRLRVGIGHDTHRLEADGPLRLGGLEIPFEKHLVGHSDADVLLHAITDALLGAASAGDIGELYPDTDPANQDRDSAMMLATAHDRVNALGFRIINLDCIVFAQRPKLSPHKTDIRDRVATILGLNPTQVGIKAKTGERVGPVGREECISAECVALLVGTDSPRSVEAVSGDP